MRAMALKEAAKELVLVHSADPEPGPGQVRLTVTACGICRTDLHIVDGELAETQRPLVPGHQIVGVVNAVGSHADRFAIGDRVGVPWLGWTCGVCRFCASARENLCDSALFTGYNLDGGFAEMTVVDERFCFALPDDFPDLQAAPLLCAGLIGYRALSMVGEAARIGFFGFGAAAHILTQIVVWQGRRVFAFTRPGDTQSQHFAQSLGATWVGATTDQPDEPLDAAILFAPAGDLVPRALRLVEKGGVVVCAGIHMSDIPAFPYTVLWGERSVRSVANLTRKDGEEFLALAPRVPIKTEVSIYPLEDANRALADLRSGSLQGAAVLSVE